MTRESERQPVRTDSPLGLQLGWVVLMATLCSASLASVSTPMARGASVADLVCAWVAGSAEQRAKRVEGAGVGCLSRELGSHAPALADLVADRRPLLSLHESALPPPAIG